MMKFVALNEKLIVMHSLFMKTENFSNTFCLVCEISRLFTRDYFPDFYSFSVLCKMKVTGHFKGVWLLNRVLFKEMIIINEGYKYI